MFGEIFKITGKNEDEICGLIIVPGGQFILILVCLITFSFPSFEPFAQFISDNNITEFYITGADATACVKSTCFNMTKTGYTVTVLSDCITSYDKSKIPDMLHYYESKGCSVKRLNEV